MSTPVRAWLEARIAETGPWICAGATAGTIAFFVDMARARSLGGHGTLDSSATSTLLAGHWVFQALALAMLALAWVAGASVGRIVARPWLASVMVPALVLVGLLAKPSLAVGTALSSGAWIAEQSFAPVVRYAPLLAVTAAAPIVAALGWGRPLGSRRLRHALSLALVGVAGVCVVADHTVFPGLYPEFHLFAYASFATATLLAARRAFADVPRLGDKRWLVPLSLACAMGLAFAPVAWFGASGKVVADLLLYSPAARDWIRVAMPARRAEPLRALLDDLDVSDGDLDDTHPASTERGQLEVPADANVLFVVVDTLRGDALPPHRPAEGTEFARPGDTPFLDGWLEGTFRFRNAYAAATMTHRSMPSMFRSIEVFEDPLGQGEALGHRLDQFGITPVACVVEYFYTAKYASVGGLLDGFEDIAVYEKKYTDTIVPSTREILQQLGDRRFFAWVHFYNMHDPGFDERVLERKDGSRVERYRRSLRWLDGQMAALMQVLDELQLSERTIVFVVSDHGEGLGDHGQMLHGPDIFEGDIHVPLAIRVPGHEGAIVDETVGNIDLVPTLMDLLGAPANPEDRGRSLVPTMASAARGDPAGTAMPRPYYIENNTGESSGMVIGRQKLIYEPKADVTYRFLLDDDPSEETNAFDPEDEYDRALLRRLVEVNPALVKDELDEPETVALLEQRLDEVEPDDPGAALPFLLRVAALKPSDEAMKIVVSMFSDSDDPRVRLLVLRHMFGVAPKKFEKPVAKWIDDVAGTPLELEVVAGLARQGQANVAGTRVIARMEHWLENGGWEQWEPYLLLIRRWRKSARYFAEVLGGMLERCDDASVPTRVVELVLDNVATMRHDAGDDLGPLVAACRPLLRSDESRVRAATLRAIASLRAVDVRSEARAMMLDTKEDPRVRREATAAYVAIAGEAAIEDLEGIADEQNMTTVVVRQLRVLGSPKALPFLEQLEAKHYNWFVRREVRRVIAEIRKKHGRGAKSVASGDDEGGEGTGPEQAGDDQ